MRAFGLIAVIIVLGVGFFIYERRTTDVMQGGSPQEQIDVAAIRQRLLTIAQTERQYQASNGKYATLEELASAAPDSRSPRRQPIPPRPAGRRSKSPRR